MMGKIHSISMHSIIYHVRISSFWRRCYLKIFFFWETQSLFVTYNNNLPPKFSNSSFTLIEHLIFDVVTFRHIPLYFSFLLIFKFFSRFFISLKDIRRFWSSFLFAVATVLSVDSFGSSSSFRSASHICSMISTWPFFEEFTWKRFFFLLNSEFDFWNHAVRVAGTGVVSVVIEWWVLK